jgi:hypothetical protein
MQLSEGAAAALASDGPSFFIKDDTYEVTLNPNLPDWYGYEKKRLTYRGILQELPTSQKSGSYGGISGPIKIIRTLEDLEHLTGEGTRGTAFFREHPAEFTLIVDGKPVKFSLFGPPKPGKDAVKSIEHITTTGGKRKKRTKRYKKRKILSKKYK